MKKDLSRDQRQKGMDPKYFQPFTNDCGHGNDKISTLSHINNGGTFLSLIGRNEYHSTVILNSDQATQQTYSSPFKILREIYDKELRLDSYV